MIKIIQTAEQRTSLTQGAEFRAKADGGQKYLEGYFVRFNDPTNLYADQYETVAPEAIPDDIGEQDVRALFNHDTALVLGRTKSGTLKLNKDDKGLYGRVAINNDDPQALSIYARVQRGDVSQASFGFTINDFDLEHRASGDYSTLTDINLYEVSVVAFPAYPSTQISAREADIAKLKRERFDEQKTKLIKELKKRWKTQS